MLRAIHEIVGEMERPQRLERRTRALARPGALIGDRMLDRLLSAERRLAERVGRLFADYDVLLTPVMSEPAVPAGIMEGRGATATYLWATGWVPFEALWNSTGQPAASVPAGFSATGLPLAVQIVGRPARRGDAAVPRRAARSGASVGRPSPAGELTNRRLTSKLFKNFHEVLDRHGVSRNNRCAAQLISWVTIAQARHRAP